MTGVADVTTGGTDDEPEQLQVAFPATPTFTRIGRVAVVGLALRLGHGEKVLDQLRGAVDEAVTALQGPGRIDVRASWTTEALTISLQNPEATIPQAEELAHRLSALVGAASVSPGVVQLILDAPAT